MDIANDFGITRHMIKTDTEQDEELYEVNKDAEIICDKIETIDNGSEVEDQMKYLDTAPGKKLYSEWVNDEYQKDQKALEKVLSTKIGREAYIQANHIDPTDFAEAHSVYTVPDSVFTDFYSDENAMERQDAGAGNLYERFMKVMSVR